MKKPPESRESILRQMRDAEEAAAQLIAGVSYAQGNWHPVPGMTWSIWQCLDHLVLTNRAYAKALQDAVSQADEKYLCPTKGIVPGRFGRWFLRNVEPPVKVGIKTKAAIKPAAEGDLETALTYFVDSHEAFREILRSWDGVDLNRVRYKNPFVPLVRFTVGTGLLIVNGHDRRHLWQAQRVKSAPGYDRV